MYYISTLYFIGKYNTFGYLTIIYRGGRMNNLTAFWLVDMLLGPVMLIVLVIIVIAVSIIWTLAFRTFKKIPWNFMWIFIVSFVVTLKKIWINIFPKLWLEEFKKRRRL